MVHVSNVSYQGAVSGNVSANKDTNVGNLMSGPASNTNTTSTMVTLGN
jgi:hypothetical protein